MAFNNEIEQLKGQIKVLEKKLALLEELEKTKSPVEEAYKEWWGEYPTNTWQVDVNRWEAFQMGYNAAYAEKVSEEPEENEWKLVALRLGEKLSDNGPGGYYDFTPGEWFEWALNECNKETAQERGERVHNEMEETIKIHDGYGVVDYQPSPQTPEQVADGLKEAFREAVKQGVVSSVDKPKDDFMDRMVAELKGKTLMDLIYDWWEDIFTKNSDLDMENCIGRLVYWIEEWLPKEQSAAGSQNAYVESAVEGFNDAIQKIKRKLR